ncbi:MAG: IS1634 family transposase [Bifidobacteriaceae bacterium]|nr:IS1634 family transposase [Bifidobacteriaceae bacterium]
MRHYQSALLRQAWKQDGKVKRHTVASLAGLPPAQVDALEAVLNRGARPCQHGPADPPDAELGPGLAHGAVAAAWAMACKLQIPGMLGGPSRERDLIMGLAIARVCHPGSKIARASWWADTTLGEDLALGQVGEDEICRAMDWLGERQDAVEGALAARFLKDPRANPAKLVFYDLTSTWVEGSKRELAERGYSRDKKKGRKQIEFALVCAPGGIPVGVRVFPGNTAGPDAFKSAITAVKDQHKMDVAIMAGDRGMVTGARIEDLRERDGLGWVGALDRPQVAALAEDRGPLQPSLFDQTGLFRFASPDYPGEMLVACRNPFNAEASKARREDLIKATLEDLAKIPLKGRDRKPKTTAQLERAVGAAVNRREAGKFINAEVLDGKIAAAANPEAVAKAERVDGIHAIRTSLTEDQMAPQDVVRVHRQLSRVEADFKMLKSVDMQARPVRHWLAGRVREHLLICLLAAVIAWHLREAWKPLTFQDEEDPEPTTPSRPAQRSEAADVKASRRRRADGIGLRSFGELLDHLGLMTRNPIAFATAAGTVAVVRVSAPTADQAEAFRLIGAKVPPKISYQRARS